MHIELLIAAINSGQSKDAPTVNSLRHFSRVLESVVIFSYRLFLHSHRFDASGRKDNAMKNNATPFSRQSRFNAERSCYLDSDFNYVYRYKSRRADGTYETKEIKIPYSEENREVFILLDREDHDADLADRYEEENKDWEFQNKMDKYASEDANGSDDEFRDSPIDCIPESDSDVFEQAFPEYKEKPQGDSRRVELREWISTLPDTQQNLIFAHLGEDKFLEDIRREEELETGKKITKQAMHNRWTKILQKGCKHFGVEKPKQKHGED